MALDVWIKVELVTFIISAQDTAKRLKFIHIQKYFTKTLDCIPAGFIQ